jgi:hypothetical protein
MRIRHVGPLTASSTRRYRCARREGLGTDAGVAGGEVHLEPILLPIALNRTTMKVLTGIQTSNLLESAKNCHGEAGATASELVLCRCCICVMRGAKWLVRHKMAMLAWDIHSKNEPSIVVATTLEPGRT